MFSNIGQKLVLKKMGISSKDIPDPFGPSKAPAKGSSKTAPLDDGLTGANGGWPAWMSVKNLPLTVQPWLAPPPPAVPVAPECPKPGDLAPFDRDHRLQSGGGQKVLVVFLRCVGCAFAQKAFVALRALANRHGAASGLRCVAVSHASREATQKWLDLLGGAWGVQVLVDEDRAVYAAWGLGLGSLWSLLNPATQAQGWREKGWLGQTVATGVQRERGRQLRVTAAAAGGRKGAGGPAAPAGIEGEEEEEEEVAGPSTIMGNKWQQAGAFAIDGRGTVVWGGKALRADEVLDLDAGIRALGL